MRQIGFKNFRRFENFPSMDLAPITIFVGENNAGKSTVVKGILALSDFLNRQKSDYLDSFLEGIDRNSEKEKKNAVIKILKNQKFYFNTSYLAHIGTFKRALFNRSNEGVITFFTSIGTMGITIDVLGDKNDEESVSGIISNITIEDNEFGLKKSFDLQNDIAKVRFAPISSDEIERGTFPEKITDLYNQYPEPIEFSFCISDYLDYFDYYLAPDFISALASSVEDAIEVTLEPKTA